VKIVYLVHQFFPEFYTGTEKFVLNIARMVQKNGNKVKVITYSYQNPNSFTRTRGEILFKEYMYEGIPVLAFRHRNIPSDVFKDRRVANFAKEVLAREQPDLVHVGHPMRVGGFIYACIRRRIPYIVTLTDFYLQCKRGIMVRADHNLCDGPHGGGACKTYCHIPGIRNRLAAATTIMKTARYLLAPSRFVAAMLQKEFHVPVTVLNHGMSYRKIRRNDNVYKPGDPITFFYGGSLSAHKGVHLIIDAMKKIDLEQIKVKIYGSANVWNVPYVEELRRSAAADPRIEFCGEYTENDIQDIFQHVDVAIVPSVWYENYPLTLHEALASGIPALVSGVGGMAEKIKDGYNGYTFRIGDSDDLAHRMRQLALNPTEINHLKSNMSKFWIPTIEQETYAYERIYNSIV